MTTWKTISYYEASGNEKVVFMQSTCMFNHRVGYCYNSWILDNNLSGKIHRPDSSSKGSYLSSENGGVGNGGAVLGRLRRTCEW
ncbi:hypothetical protein HanHA300_Chr10g0355371 [Helianthus annuus]|nr:hypothetical protein HanHA300_Chr10g0355371 [Helianthus annuus]KAJ0529362.1 hypothetical protein HanHA89_Chr10g0376981 [Helianthus annuus]KAJ0696247.1 hypothetical protein HanLR1_Chr10g0354871 [Helianthus annuus]